MSIVLLLGGLSRGILYYEGWAMYDALIGLPVSGIINTWSVMATTGVTIGMKQIIKFSFSKFLFVDRVVFLWRPNQCNKSRFCTKKQARKLMCIGGLISIIINLPYCFIFTWNNKGHLETTKFFRSKWVIYYTGYYIQGDQLIISPIFEKKKLN